MNDPHTEGVLIRHGLGKPKVRCRAGETFEDSEKRLFRDAREMYRAGMAMARAGMENAHLDPDALTDFNNLTTDMEAHWRVDPRAEE